MAYIPTQGNSIIVEQPSDKIQAPSSDHSPLVSWLTSRADDWERHRDNGYQARWAEYWRMWRGTWAEEDRNRPSERSRLIAPALAQAIEMTVAEIEEALFSKEQWFDVVDGIDDEEKNDAILARNFLLEDLERVNAKDAISEAALNAAIFGTGIVKINTDITKESYPKRDPATQKLTRMEEVSAVVHWESIRPDEFIPDPAGRTIVEMMGCFHKVKKPLHCVLEKIEAGTYLESALAFLSGTATPGTSAVDPSDPQNNLGAETEEVTILEYHGKVPIGLLNAIGTQTVTVGDNGEVEIKDATPVDAILNATDEDGPMVEAIVTIANDSVLLRAAPSPFVMMDRSIVAFQFEKVPGRFWGRGVAEKGYNPQKALDAELRSRADALGYISSPMLGVDGGRVPRGFKMEIRPGKVWLTQGPPREILQPIEIGQLNPSTFNQTGEMERMVQMATGAFDTATQLRGQDANGPQQASLMMGAFVKRAKRAIRSINDNMVQPLLKKTLWRYMQFSPVRYPSDFDFRVMATMGIVAREVEAMQLTQLMGMMPEQYPQLTAAIAKGIVDLSSLHNKMEIVAAMDQALAPPSEEEQARKKELDDLQLTAIRADAQGKLMENQQIAAQTRKLLVEAMQIEQETQIGGVEIQIEMARLKKELEELDLARDQLLIEQARVRVENRRVDVEARKAERPTSIS